MFSVQQILWVLFFLTNTIAFLVMLWDKRESRKPGRERVSEGMLFFLATLFGSLGVYLGMFVFRHKTRKWYFLIGIPLLMIQNLATLYLVSLYLRESYLY